MLRHAFWRVSGKHFSQLTRNTGPGLWWSAALATPDAPPIPKHAPTKQKEPRKVALIRKRRPILAAERGLVRNGPGKDAV